jgi:hypothetical protein
MTTLLTSLLADPRLHPASALPIPPKKSRAAMPFFAPGELHEFFLANDLPSLPTTTSPVALLTLLATQKLQAPGGDPSPRAKGHPRRELSSPPPRLVYIGKSCWPSFQLVAAALAPHPLENALFLDPLSDAEKFWAIGQALRCPSVSAIIADGSKINPTISRRLQLAAESHDNRVAGGEAPRAFLARPLQEKEQPSWAASRWEVRPLPSTTFNPQWLLECFSCRRQHAGQDAPRRWIADCSYQVLRGTVSFHLSTDVGHRAAQTPPTLQQDQSVRIRSA